MEVCFVCNKQSFDCYQNLTELRSTHSATATISELIKRFLNDSESSRNVDDDTNCVCSDCFKQISFYDVHHTKAVEQEAKLKRILLATEALFSQKVVQIKVENETDEYHSESIFVDSVHLAENAHMKIEPHIELMEDHIELDKMIEPMNVVEVSGNKPNTETPAEEYIVLQPQLLNGRNATSSSSGAQRENTSSAEEKTVYVCKNPKVVEVKIVNYGSNTMTSTTLPAKRKFSEMNDAKLHQGEEAPTHITFQFEPPLREVQKVTPKWDIENDEGIFPELEDYYKTKYPSCLKKILLKSGYAHELALQTLNEEKIITIEYFVNRNKNLLVQTMYEKNPMFKFLPGHRAILTDIPHKIAGYKKTKLEKMARETSQMQFTQERRMELRQSLVEKVINYTKKINFEQTSSIRDVTQCKEVNSQLQCRIKCPICDKQYLCNYKTYWAISNLEHHIRNHKAASRAVTSATFKSSSTSSSSSPNFLLAHIPHQDGNEL